MTAFEKGQQNQPGSTTKSSDASPKLDDFVPKRGLRKDRVGADPARRHESGDEAELSEQKSQEMSVVRWLQLLAAVGIPLLLAYIAIASLVNPQFAELRELGGRNRDAIAANTSSIQSLEAKLDSNIARLEAKINLVAEVLILANTNENITETELRNLLNAGEE